MLMSCAEGTDIWGGRGSGDSNPVSASSFDISMSDVTPNGCLDLQLLSERLRSLPTTTQVRQHTTDFQIESAPGSRTKPRRNFIALAAFSNYLFEEMAAELALAQSPTVTQNSCQSVAFASEIGGSEEYFVRQSEKPTQLHLVREDGAQLIYEIKSPREISLISISSVIDPCPSYPEAKIKKEQLMRWGPQEELNQLPAAIQTQFLSYIAMSIVDMPSGLAGAMAHSSSEVIQAKSNDLRSLMASTVDPEIHECPYKAKPPSGSQPQPDQPPSTDDPDTEPDPEILPEFIPEDYPQE